MKPANEQALVVPAHVVAKMLGRSAPWFYGHREDLEKSGFPAKDKLLGGWLRPAVEQWLARRAGILAVTTEDDDRRQMEEAIDEAKKRREGRRVKDKAPRGRRVGSDAVRHQPAG